MVIEDGSCPNVQHSEAARKSSFGFDAMGPGGFNNLASVWDRFAAFIIDHFIILSPVYVFLSSPFEQALKEHLLLGQEAQATYVGGTLFLLAAGILFIYHSVFTFGLGATLGQFFMGLQVQNVWSYRSAAQSTSLWNACLRTLGWMASLILLGLPLLALFSDPQRRIWYERVSDSITLKRRSKSLAGRPSLFQQSVVQGFYASLLVLLTVMGLWKVSTFFKAESALEDLMSRLEEEGVYCAEVSEAQTQWVEVAEVKPERLEVAFGLYLSGELTPDCLAAEFDERGFVNQESALSLLVKAFVYEDNLQLSDMYLHSVCEVDNQGVPCRFSQSLLHQDAGDIESYHQAIQKVDTEDPLYWKLWALQQNLESENYPLVSELREQIPSVEALTETLVLADLKLARWSEGLDSVVKSAKWLASMMSPESTSHLNTWICYEQIADSCDNWRSSACQDMQDMLQQGIHDLNEDFAIFTSWKQNECQVGEAADYAFLSQKSTPPSLRRLLRAKVSEDRKGLRDLAFDSRLSPKLRSTAFKLLLENDPDPEDILRAQVEWWRQSFGPLNLSLGRRLMEIFMDQKDYSQVAKLAESLWQNSNTVSQKFLQDYIISEHHLGRIEKAKSLLTSFKLKFPAAWIAVTESSESRAPASVSDESDTEQEFAIVARSLK